MFRVIARPAEPTGNGSPLRRDPKSIHKLAAHAVKDLYQFCPSYSRKILDTVGFCWRLETSSPPRGTDRR
jgi:hypothetical protein